MTLPDETVTTDILIVGGGISGAALAARLAPLGWNIVLVERNPDPIDTARGDHLQPRTAELLDRWGLLERFMVAGAEKRMGTTWKSVDGDVLLDLQALIEQCYRKGRYEKDLDYRADPEPPDDGRAPPRSA